MITKRMIALPAALLLGGGAALPAQTAISSLTTTFTTGTSTSHVTLDGSSVTADNDTLAVKTITDSSGNTYTVLSNSNAAYVRTDGANNDPVTGQPNANQFSDWYYGAANSSGNPTSFLGAYDSGKPSSILLGNNLLEGGDNLFQNSNADQNNGDVERLDFVFSGTSGTTATSSMSLAVFDRGTGDAFDIAIITGVDSNGNPTSYGGALLHVDPTDFGNSLLSSSNAPASVLNSGGDPTNFDLLYTSTTSLAASNLATASSSVQPIIEQNQNISGVVFNLSDFGIATGTKIYGYSIMGGDVTDGGNINNLVNYNNTAYFPTNTDDPDGSCDSGGLDMADVGGVLFQEHPLPEPSTYGALLIGAGLAGIGLRRRFLRPAC